MFQGLRSGSLFYVLEKTNKPTLKIGQVVSVSNPMPKYQNNIQPQPIGSIFPTTEQVVDVTIKVNETTFDYQKLPALASIANFGNGIIVSDSKEAMMAEVETMQKTSKEIINSIDYHTSVVATCDDILQSLNPQLAKDKEQETKINNLEDKVSRMECTLDDIRTMLSRTLGAKKKSNDDDTD